MSFPFHWSHTYQWCHDSLVHGYGNVPSGWWSSCRVSYRSWCWGVVRLCSTCLWFNEYILLVGSINKSPVISYPVYTNTVNEWFTHHISSSPSYIINTIPESEFNQCSHPCHHHPLPTLTLLNHASTLYPMHLLNPEIICFWTPTQSSPPTVTMFTIYISQYLVIWIKGR